MTDTDTRCHICGQSIYADPVMASVHRAGVREVVPVHRDCIERYLREVAREAWLGSAQLRTEARRAGKRTFGDWYGK